MKTIKFYPVLILMLLSAMTTNAQTSNDTKPTIIFVHGIWADGSCYASQIKALQAKGYPVMSVQNAVTSLADDVNATKKAIQLAKGNVILVGHSWGGMVITQAGNDPKVQGMVYLAAYAPDADESLTDVSKNAPETELAKYLIPTDGTVFISEEGVKKVFAPGLNPQLQAVVYATQVPAIYTVFNDKSAAPAWKNKRCWYIVAKNDQTIHPDLERFMAKRMKAKTIEIASSHVMMLSHPDEVLKVIEEAATYKY